jgi:hypothetical protein
MKKLLFLVALLAFGFLAPSSAHAAQPVGYWNFEEQTGSQVIGRPLRNSGMLTGASRGGGKVGMGVWMNGSGGVTIYPSEDFNSLLGGFTFSAWINPSSNVSGYVTIFSKSPNPLATNPADVHNQLHIRVHNDGHLQFVLNNHVDFGGFQGFTPAGVVPHGSWSFVTWTYDETIHRIHVNGVEVFSASFNQPWTGNSEPLGIGQGVEPFVGSIDEVRVYKGAQTLEEIVADMNNTTVQPTGVYLDWGFPMVTAASPQEVKIEFQVSNGGPDNLTESMFEDFGNIGGGPFGSFPGEYYTQTVEPWYVGLNMAPGESKQFHVISLTATGQGAPPGEYGGEGWMRLKLEFDLFDRFGSQSSRYPRPFRFTILPPPNLSDILTFPNISGLQFQVITSNIAAPLMGKIGSGRDLTVDSNGNIYVGGVYRGAPGYSSPGSAAVMRILQDGTSHVVAYVNPPEGFQSPEPPEGMAFDPDGNLIVQFTLKSVPDGYMTVHPLVRITGLSSAVVEPVATPTIDPSGGVFDYPVDATIATATAGAEIRTTLDGNIPTALSALYTGPIQISQSGVLKAKAFKFGRSDSAVASASFTIQAASPIISPAGGSFVSSVQVSLSSSTSGATIRYTTDGSTPNSGSTVYGSPFTLTSSKPVKAYASKSGMTDSGVASADFTITQPAGTITIPASGTSTRSTGWLTTNSTELWYWNANQWLEYSVDFGAGGSRTISATAINHNSAGLGLPAGYTFNLTVLIDGVNKGTLKVPGSTTLYKTGSLVVTAPAGVHTVRFTWTNDVWTAGLYDSNIQVKEVSIAP